MRTITFQGNSYNVPEWAKWIARDMDTSVYVFSEKPEIAKGLLIWVVSKGNAIRVYPIQNNDGMICEEII